jgi:hypothetical protein
MSLAQLSQLLPLPEEELQQVLDYAATLSKPDAVSHFSNLLGDTPLAVDFISSFNARRKDPSSAPPSAPTSGPSSSTESPDAVPKLRRGGNQNKKKKAPLHTPQPRRIDNYDATIGGGTAYNKKNNDLDYIPQHQRASAPTSQQPSRTATPSNKPSPAPAPKEKEQRPSAGYLVSDIPPSKSKAKSNPTSRTSTPKPSASSGPSTTKISISGGTPMAGQSTALADLDAAIRALEITTKDLVAVERLRVQTL